MIVSRTTYAYLSVMTDIEVVAAATDVNASLTKRRGIATYFCGKLARVTLNCMFTFVLYDYVYSLITYFARNYTRWNACATERGIVLEALASYGNS